MIPSQPPPSPPPSPKNSDSMSNSSTPRKIKPGALVRTTASLNLVDMKERDEKARAVKARAREMKERIDKREAHKLPDPNKDKISKTTFEHIKTLYELMGKAAIVEASSADKKGDSVVITQRKAELRTTNLEIGKILNTLKSASFADILVNLNLLEPLLNSDEKENFCKFLFSRMGIDWSLTMVEVILTDEVLHLDTPDNINRMTDSLGQTFVGQVQRALLLPVLSESLMKILNSTDTNLLNASDAALNLIIESLKKASPQNLSHIQRFYMSRLKTASKRDKVNPEQAVISLLFLRFIGYALTTPKKVGLETENQKVKVVKVLNGIVNQTTPKEIEGNDKFIQERGKKLKEIVHLLTAA